MPVSKEVLMREAPWLDREYIQSAGGLMRLYGMTAEDSVFAAASGSCMLALDHACMPAGVPPIVVEYNLRQHVHVIAQTHHAVANRPKLRERYEIFVPNFGERMRRVCAAQLLLRRDRLDVATMTMALAAHEVRHRLQRRSKIGRFTPFCNPGSDILLKAVVGVLSETFKDNKDRLPKDAKGENLARTFHSDEEFDAQVIERVVSRRGPACTTVDALAHLVMLEPTL